MPTRTETLEDRTLLSAMPVADIADPAGPVYEGDGLTLDASGSYDDDSDPLSFAWDINGDGTFGEVTGESPALLWDDLQSFGLGDDGTYTIGVKVSDGIDGSDTAFVDVTVVNVDPMVMDFSTLGTPAYPGDTITVDASFEDRAESADSYTYVVGWGDGTSTGSISLSYGSAISAGHEYAAAGDYLIELTVSDDDGGFGSWSELVTIDPDLDPIFDQSSYSFSVLETAAPPDAEVGTVSASDPEAHLPKYALGLGAGMPGPIQFDIDEDTGLITVASSLDYEAQPSHSLVAYATDPAGNRATADVLITVEDVGLLAADDVMYAGQGDPAGNAVTFYVLENDEHLAGESLTITGVTDPANGSVTLTGSDVTYTPDSGFYSGTDTFEYTIQDIHGETATASVTVNMVEVTSWTVEWLDPDGIWTVSPDGEAIGSHDDLRWSATHNGPTTYHTATDWEVRPWDQPGADWSPFASSPPGDYAYGNPGVGDWLITPAVIFDNFINAQGELVQGPFKARGQGNQQKNIPGAEIMSVGWTASDADANELERPGKLVEAIEPGGLNGVRFFPDAEMPGQIFGNLVDVTVTVAPAKAGVRVYLKWFDVDDPSSAQAPLDADPDPIVTQINPDDNRTALDPALYDPSNPFAGDGTLVPLLTDENGVARARMKIKGPNPRPGDNYRIAASLHVDELERVVPQAWSSNAPLFYDGNGDGFQNAGDGLIDDTWSSRGIRASKLLTIWRYLHIEIDTMEPVTGNLIHGIANRVVDNLDGTANVELANAIQLRAGEEKRFEDPGSVLIDTRGYEYPILSIPNVQTVKVEIPGGFDLPLESFEVILQDDDYLQDGDAVPPPDTTEVPFALAGAFIEPIFDLSQHSGDAPFKPNVPSEQDDPEAKTSDIFAWGSQPLNSEEYWVTYVLSGFQYIRQDDGDGEPELPPVSVEHEGGSVIFNEAAREVALDSGWDFSETLQDAVVHELAHAISSKSHEDLNDSGKTTHWENDSVNGAIRYLDIWLEVIRLADKPNTPD